MKIGLASDLHLDFGAINPEFFEWRGDVLLLPGDLFEVPHLHYHDVFLERVADMAECVLVVAGNHEFYGSNLQDANEIIRQHLRRWRNITLLDNAVFVHHHVEFFGGTLWTDYHGDPMAELYAQANINDFEYVKYDNVLKNPITPRHIIQQNQLTKNAIYQFLDEGLPENKKVIMTHHAPSRQSIASEYKHDELANRSFVNNFDSLIEAQPNLAAWVHGHTHGFFDYFIGETRVMCNAHGYPHERPARLPPYQPFTFEV